VRSISIPPQKILQFKQQVKPQRSVAFTFIMPQKKRFFTVYRSVRRGSRPGSKKKDPLKESSQKIVLVANQQLSRSASLSEGLASRAVTRLDNIVPAGMDLNRISFTFLAFIIMTLFAQAFADFGHRHHLPPGHMTLLLLCLGRRPDYPAK
jgi:hypothetical protein